MNIKSGVLIGVLSLLVNFTYCQNLLLADKAVELAIEHNFNIKRAQNATEVAKNNASKYNTGKLPSVALSGGANWNVDNSNVTFQDGSKTHLSWISTQNANAAINTSYTIFNGYFRKHNIEQLKERYALSNLQVQAAMENLAAQTLSQYYSIASIENALDILKEAINISQQRLLRAQTQVEYGQGNELNVLNAQVDLNNDSLNYQNALMNLDVAKRNLNKLLISGDATDYTVSQEIVFYENLDKQVLRQSVIDKNIQLQQMDKNIQIGNISIDMANASKLPSLSANLGYSFSYGNNSPASFLSSQNSNGLNAGLTLNWNIFDGGATKVAVQNAKLNTIDLQYQKEQLQSDLEIEFDVAWANYQNSLIIYRTNEKNELISRRNFERTAEQYKIGQITSVDFRQAQLNLLNAQSGVISALFDVKINEIQLLLLSGNILN